MESRIEVNSVESAKAQIISVLTDYYRKLYVLNNNCEADSFSLTSLGTVDQAIEALTQMVNAEKKNFSARGGVASNELREFEEKIRIANAELTEAEFLESEKQKLERANSVASSEEYKSNDTQNIFGSVNNNSNDTNVSSEKQKLERANSVASSEECTSNDTSIDNVDKSHPDKNLKTVDSGVKSKPSVTLNAVALTAAILLALGAAATLVAIYMPGHMPEAMSAFVDILEALKDILVPTASVFVGLSAIGIFYESAQIHKKNNVLLAEDFHTSESTSNNQLQ